MCLAVPAKLVRMIDEHMAEVESFGNKRTIGIDLVPGVRVGDYVLVHAGYAIQVVDEAEALESLKLWEELSRELEGV